MSRGVLYVATGKQYVEETLISAKIFKSVLDIPIALATDRDVGDEAIDHVISIDDPEYGFGDQIYAMQKTPFDRTLYLDSDIYVHESPSEVFDVLDEFEIGAVQVPHWQPREEYPLESVPESFPEYNSGVLVYKNTKPVQELLNSWKTKHRRDINKGYNRNQRSFREALYSSDVRIATLTPEYNCRYQFPERASRTVKIFHGRLLDIDTDTGGMHQLMNIEDVAEKINKKTGPRVFYPKRRSVEVKSLDDSYWYRIEYTLRRDGIVGTTKKAVREIRQKLSNWLQ